MSIPIIIITISQLGHYQLGLSILGWVHTIRPSTVCPSGFTMSLGPGSPSITNTGLGWVSHCLPSGWPSQCPLSVKWAGWVRVWAAGPPGYCPLVIWVWVTGLAWVSHNNGLGPSVWVSQCPSLGWAVWAGPLGPSGLVSPSGLGQVSHQLAGPGLGLGPGQLGPINNTNIRQFNNIRQLGSQYPSTLTNNNWVNNNQSQ